MSDRTFFRREKLPFFSFCHQSGIDAPRFGFRPDFVQVRLSGKRPAIRFDCRKIGGVFVIQLMRGKKFLNHPRHSLTDVFRFNERLFVFFENVFMFLAEHFTDVRIFALHFIRETSLLSPRVIGADAFTVFHGVDELFAKGFKTIITKVSNRF